ncbi:MAG: riboflavin synthase [Candidatus Tokpelaia sp. JSC161]|jgi:riboflavin synthase|nr:MAG: riboflavin synthase [Candidatus Tokpelaia sp. JSC161]
MFTGIVTAIGVLEERSSLQEGLRLRISSQYESESLKMGASISCSGICLTVVALSEKGVRMPWFEVEAWEETLRLSTLSFWKIGERINLERSLKIGDELGGHLVYGHIHGISEIIAAQDEGLARRFKIQLPANLASFVIPKGSIALNGTSLTVNFVNKSIFDVLLTRYTLDMTIWGESRVGDFLNTEVDMLACYGIYKDKIGCYDGK